MFGFSQNLLWLAEASVFGRCFVFGRSFVFGRIFGYFDNSRFGFGRRSKFPFRFNTGLWSDINLTLKLRADRDWRRRRHATAEGRKEGARATGNRSTANEGKGPSIYDVRKILGFFDPLPPCLHLGLIYSTKFTQPPLLHLLLGKPPLPPQCGRHIWMPPSKFGCSTAF